MEIADISRFLEPDRGLHGAPSGVSVEILANVAMDATAVLAPHRWQLFR